MNELTHEQARRLIQAAADRALNGKDRSHLKAHLAECAECRVYETEQEQLQATLLRALRVRWYLRRPSRGLDDRIRARVKRDVRRGRILRTANHVTQWASLLVIAVLFIHLVEGMGISPGGGPIATQVGPSAPREVVAVGRTIHPAEFPAVEFEPDEIVATSGEAAKETGGSLLAAMKVKPLRAE